MQLDTTLFNRLGSKRLLLAGIPLAAIGAGLASQSSWLAAVGAASLLVGAAPCVAMCALGLCIDHICGSTGSAAPNGTSQRSGDLR